MVRATSRQQAEWWASAAESLGIKPDKPDLPVPMLKDFLVGAWTEVLHPSEHLEMGWYIDLFCEWLTVVSVGTAINFGYPEVASKLLQPYGMTLDTLPDELKDVRYLLFNISPRCAKSTVITVCWPVWEWLTMPWLSHMALSFSQPLATDHSDDRRTIVTSQWYQWLCGGMRLSGSKNRVTEYRNDSMGQHLARSTEAGVTGGGALRLIFDDGNDPNKADSETTFLKNLKSYKNYSRSRRNDPKRSAVINVQQRSSERDISQFILENEPQYIKVIIPMEAESEEVHKFPLSGRIVARQAGDLMHPERFPADVLDVIKKDPIVWAGQYQQRPNPEGGGIFKIENWRLAIAPPRLARQIISVDATFDAGETNDYAVVGVVGQTGPVRIVKELGPINQQTGQQTLIDVPQHQYWVPERWRQQADIDQTKQAISQFAARYPEAYTKLVEAKANGPAIVAQMSKMMPGFMPYDPGTDSKTKRATAMSVVQKRGDVILPADDYLGGALAAMGRTSITVGEWWELHPPPKKSSAEHVPTAQWAKEFIDEHTIFPSGKKDDQVDFLAQAINWMEANPVVVTNDYNAADFFSG